MKKAFLILGMAVTLAACSADNDTNESATDTTQDHPIDEGNRVTDSTAIVNDSVIMPKGRVDSAGGNIQSKDEKDQ